MTWKDIWKEIFLKFNINIGKRKPRKIKIQRHSIDEFMTNAQIIKNRIEIDFEERLKKRSSINSHLRTDDRLFEPFTDLLVLTTIGRENFSFVREIGIAILRLIKKYEDDNAIRVNKSHLYFGLSLNSIYLNDTINAMIYWELSQKEESLILGSVFNASTAISDSIGKFSSVINPVSYSLKESLLYGGLRNHYSFIPDFSEVLKAQPPPEIFAYFSAALRFRQIDYWLKTEFTAMTKIYSQELINSLCILCEANLKNYPAVTRNMYGPIINDDLVNINAGVSSLIGTSNPPSGLFLSYPTNSELNFNTYYPQLVTAVKSNSLLEDNLKAHLIYGAYMLRNKSLHDYNSGLIYFNNNVLFEDTIGLLFAAVAAIKAL